MDCSMADLYIVEFVRLALFCLAGTCSPRTQ